MSADRLTASDKRILLLWILAGLLGAGVAYKYFFQAFPEASVEFKIPRAVALERARQFASGQGANLADYQSTLVFDVDDTAKTFLERKAGLAEANRLMAADVRVWYWQARFFRPLQKEEFDVRVDPAGGIDGYAHELEEAEPGMHLERADAQAIAEAFLRDSVHLDLSRYDFLEQEANPTERTHRRDWSFSWELRGFRAHDAPYRLNVSLAGNHVDGYQEFLKVPETWKLDYARLRSSNNFLEYIALIPYAFFIGACLYVIVSLGRRGTLDWRAGLALGLFLAALYFIMTVNQWPLDRAGYDTNTPYSTFVLSQLGEAALISIVSALLVVLAVVPGEPMYRVSQPAKIRLGAPLTLRGIRTRQFFVAAVIGVCLAAVHIGYLTVFYIASGKLGAWAPQDLSYTNVVSTWLPWVYPLVIGLYAATSEEFLFRLFAIPFLQRITKSQFLAVVIPAFAWGFLHSNYPQEPAYIRGIEVGLMGVLAGLVMLRWGIWATLTWHYTVDAFLISTSLLRSQGAYLRVSGAMVGGAALIPIAIAGISYLSRGSFEPEADLLNAVRPLALAPEHLEDAAAVATSTERWDPASASSASSGADHAGPIYAAISSRAMLILIACGVLGVAVLAGAKREAIGDFVRFSIDANEATSRADQVLRENKLDPASYQHTATVAYTFDGYTNEYLRRTIGIASANRVYRDQVPSAFWMVRYFRDSQNEEYSVVLRPDASLHSLHHTMDERTPGPKLSKEDALSRAETYLHEQTKMDLTAWNLVESNSEQKPARVDHSFVWEQKAALDPGIHGQPGAHIRCELQVQGDEVSTYRTYIQIPEAWRDAESRTTPAQIAQTFGRILLAGLGLVTVLVVFLRGLKHPEVARIPWPRLGRWSVWVLFAAIVTFVNRAPELLASYTTVWPLKTYYAILFISMIFIVSLYVAAAFLLLGVGWFFLEKYFGRARLPGWMAMPGAYYRDAGCLAVFGVPAWLGLLRLPALLSRWPLARHTLAAAVPGSLDALNPAASNMAASVWIGFLAAGALAIAAGLIATYVRPAWMRAGLVVLVAALLAGNVATPGSFLRDAAFRLLTIAVLWFAVTRIARFNLMGYFLFAAMLVLIPGAVELLQQPSRYFHGNAYAILIFALALLAWPLLAWRRSALAHDA